MYRDWTIEFHGKSDLGLEAVDLGLDVRILDPSIQARLTYDSLRMAFQMLAEEGEPRRSVFLHIPRMQTEGWPHPR